jgi:hypothetical protein
MVIEFLTTCFFFSHHPNNSSSRTPSCEQQQARLKVLIKRIWLVDVKDSCDVKKEVMWFVWHRWVRSLATVPFALTSNTRELPSSLLYYILRSFLRYMPDPSFFFPCDSVRSC